MKLALFSDNLLEIHIAKLKTYFDKPLHEVKFLYITTPTNYKPYLPDWSLESENRWRACFPLLREFDLQRAYEVDKSFDFKAYFEDFDFIFVSGGNTFLLAYWMNLTGAREILKNLIMENKVVYGGESAGSVYAYKNISNYALLDNTKIAPEIINKGLGITPFAPLPHWNFPDYQKELEEIKQKFGEKQIPVVTITDEQSLFYDGSNLDLI